MTVDSMLSRNYFVAIELECAEVARKEHTPLVSNGISNFLSLILSMSSRVSMLDADVERSNSASLALVP